MTHEELCKLDSYAAEQRIKDLLKLAVEALNEAKEIADFNFFSFRLSQPFEMVYVNDSSGKFKEGWQAETFGWLSSSSCYMGATPQFIEIDE